MATAAQLEILDLRHFSAATLRPLLAEESRVWSERLRWDYRSSANLLLDYLDSHVLPGYVAVEKEKLCGYVFCVYEGSKAVIGDVYCAPALCEDALRVEDRLIEHLLELLQFSPGIDRIETQLLLHPHGAHAKAFADAGFDVHPRLFMEFDFGVAENGAMLAELPALPGGLEIRSWRDTDFAAAGRLISAAYAGHLDARINDQYQSVAGSARFLHNIVRFPGCGIFDPVASRVLAFSDSTKSASDIAGMLLCSRVGEAIGHVTQICIDPAFRRRGLGGLLLKDCLRQLASMKFDALTLTVTEDNSPAVELYRSLGFHTRHNFDAMVWKRPARER